MHAAFAGFAVLIASIIRCKVEWRGMIRIWQIGVKPGPRAMAMEPIQQIMSMHSQRSAQLPQQREPRIIQNTGAPSPATLAKCEHLLVVLPAKPAASAWSFPGGSRLARLHKRRIAEGISHTRLINAADSGVSVVLLESSGKGKQLPLRFDRLQQCGKLAAAALADNPESIGVLAAGFEPQLAEQIIADLLLAVHAHAFALPDYRKSPKKTPRLRAIRILGLKDKIDTSRIQVEARATNLVRWLTAQPPNKLDAASYRSLLKSMAEKHGWKHRFYSEQQLQQLGAGAFLAVAQGNDTRDAGIVHLRYTPAAGKSKPPLLALVGKGIIFDTGGTNLKPFKAMLDMHIDMAGSAVAVATLAALTELNYPQPVDCWLAITENRIGNTAYKSRDIVTACNGTTIEVVHTDAEGRMALADTLALAGKEKPCAMVDFATLTGSCVTALTERYSGVLSNRPQLHELLIKAGQESGERVWPFPLDTDFDDDLKSETADVLQCAPDGGGDHIQAARLLQRFVPADCNWVHVDLSSAHRKGGLAHVPGEITGFGPRFALQLILDHGAEWLLPLKA